MGKDIYGEIMNSLLFIENNRLHKLGKLSKDELLYEYKKYCTQQGNARNQDEFDQLENNKHDIIYFLHLIDFELKEGNIVLIIKKEIHG